MYMDLVQLLAWAEGRDPKAPFTLVTLVEIDGSVPQRVGAHMVVTLDGEQQGTVGGGNLEYRLVALAREMLAQRQEARCVALDLGADLGMACGGQVRAMLEPFGNRHPVVIYGCGHVCRALAPLLVSLEFDVTVVDDRPEWADSSAFPPSVKVECEEMVGHARKLGDLSQAFALVMTRGHLFDFEVLKELLQHAPGYLGVMGSASKRMTVGSMLQSLGLVDAASPHEALAAFPALHMPVGLPIGSRTPPEIAVSVAAELVQQRAERGK